MKSALHPLRRRLISYLPPLAASDSHDDNVGDDEPPLTRRSPLDRLNLCQGPDKMATLRWLSRNLRHRQRLLQETAFRWDWKLEGGCGTISCVSSEHSLAQHIILLPDTGGDGRFASRTRGASARCIEPSFRFFFSLSVKESGRGGGEVQSMDFPRATFRRSDSCGITGTASVFSLPPADYWSFRFGGERRGGKEKTG